ncbi:MAG: NADH-quinone oxidoreductase subunit L [Rhodobacter sp.]|nr:NADH-quinone oxidoreductase subunit L [Rhodobacter sp.]MCA3460333.1 NADH-quinone oxidoreductase subunit L [Rhodobacter sp.]MCA3462863.1 NADH-quinone oxidoreductase subunit L [Rhodobacter sp.]MCA3465943.1 NADH-quinone oxidoreductase subunit L [Rhodobacter sp.]MCA3471229.1 NADH-quinone oxidoreductase subunit L [Rhodobacter sp.]
MTTIILFAPLIGALICGFGWRLIGETAGQVIATGLVFLAAILSWIIFLTFDGETQQVVLMRWIDSGSLGAEWAIRLDRLTAIMLVVVNSVSALVHLYSFGYMAHDDNWKHAEHYKARFFAYLSFFTFAMLMLVTADNLVQMFFGWEGVGVASYLLIGFYYRKPSANAAAMKAFIVNRVGDFGFALGIFALFFLVDSVRFDDVFAAGPVLAETSIRFLWADWNAANLIGVLLFIGAMGKSAQLFLHTWLPDAMEGPTPVSALIHAATMVTAGVFLVCRMSPVFEYAPDAKTMIVVIGASTAFFAATVGLVQNDIKRVIAYSTCSQLGYMFVAAGVGVYSVAMFHLFTHAFFKAMLFLGAGSVIHAMHHEQDMRNYGGLRKKVPLTFWAMMIGTLAITGVGIPLTHIGFAGFLSKDAVIESAYVGSQYAFWLLVIAAFMTSFYSWRLMFMTFFGAPRGDHHAHDHARESPKMMLIPLAVLALGAVFSGMLWYKVFFGDEAKVRSWFGMPAGIEHAGAGHGPAGEAAAEDHAATTASGGEAVADDHAATTASGGEAVADDPAATTASGGEAAAGDHAATTAATAVSADAQAGPAPVQGALFFGPDNQMIHKAHGVPDWVKVSPFAAMILGLALAFQFYIRRPDLPGRLAANQRPMYLFLLNKWYFDEVYEFLFVRSAKWLGGFLWKRGDGAVIDGTINGVALGIVPFFTRLAGRAQTGYVFTYAFAMVLGIAVLVTWMTLSGGAE